MYESLVPHEGHELRIRTYVDEDDDPAATLDCLTCAVEVLTDWDFGMSSPNYDINTLGVSPESVSGIIFRELEITVPDDLRSLFE